MEINPRFQPGDLVTFRAMVELHGRGEERPQSLSVVFVRADWTSEADVCIRYYCRPFSTGMWGRRQQTFAGSAALENNTYLVEEAELVPAPEETREAAKSADEQSVGQ